MTLPNRATAPLSHLLVLDLADASAAFSSKILSSLGARVIKVEKPGSTSGGRIPGKNAGQKRNSSFSQFTDSGKYGITLDMDTVKGRSIFRKFIAAADILIETFPAGYLKKINLDYRRLDKINPRLIMVSVTGFGQNSPCKKYASNGAIASACGGQMYLSGKKEGAPLPLHGNQPYFTASLFAAAGILLALQQRKRTNRGQYIDLSLQETAAAALGHIMVRYFQDASISRRSGPIQGTGQGGIFPCRDGFIYLTYEREWDTLLDWLAGEGMQSDLKDAKWRNPEYRRRHQAHITDVLSRWTQSHSVSELFYTAQAMRLPWAPVNSVAQVLQNPQLKARGCFKSVAPASGSKRAVCPGLPFRGLSKRGSVVRRAPLPGEHNYRIYREFLGISRKKVDALSGLKVI